MTRKLSFTLILVLLALLFVTIPASAAKSYYAERFDVQIDIQEDGSAIVTETVEFHFSGDPFTFAFREISASETDGLTFLEASMDSIPMLQGTGAGQVEVETGDPLRVTWHFAPTYDAAHVFIVRYRAAGVIRKGDADTLIWRAIPEEHDYSINHSTITLTYPPRATLLGQPTLDWNHDAKWETDRIILTASGVAEDEGLILTARFSPNSLPVAAPQWQVQKEQKAAALSRALPVGLIAGIATLILGGLGLFTYVRANRREFNVSPVVPTANPPLDVSPAIVGKLMRQPHHFMGALFDLAQRGILEVREEKGFWGTKTYVILCKDHTTSLRPFEQGLLEALFKPGEAEINMSEVATRLAMNSKLFDDPLEQELIQRGWLDVERKQKQTWLTAAGAVIMFLAIIVGFISVATGGIVLSENPVWFTLQAIVIGLSAGLFILSIPLLIYAGTFSTRTPAGEDQAARWQGFAQYLKQVSKGKEPAIRPNYFETYLAYAAAFGLGAGWAKYFQSLGGIPLPVWFHATAGSEADFGALVAIMSASDSAGAGGDGGAGAGGASGGGSSGAG